MKSFREFLLESEETDNVKTMIAKLPAGHRKLLNGYKFKFTGGNTLKGDNDHIGLIHQDKITVAAPWNYPRAFTTLHEIGHLVWEYKMTPKLKKKWEKLVGTTKKSQKQNLPKKCHSALDQNAEEIFCMVYANVYAKHPIGTYSNPEWMAFIKNEVPS